MWKVLPQQRMMHENCTNSLNIQRTRLLFELGFRKMWYYVHHPPVHLVHIHTDHKSDH